MTNRPDLIAQLSKLTPTEGVWNYDSFGINTEGEILYKSFESKESDDVLITLAPTMRIAILAMAKEIERLKAEIDKNYKGYKFKKEVFCPDCNHVKCICDEY